MFSFVKMEKMREANRKSLKLIFFVKVKEKHKGLPLYGTMDG